MKKNELTHIIHKLVAAEIRKQLPLALNEAISNVIGKTQLTEQQRPAQHSPDNGDLESDFRSSMMAMFDGDVGENIEYNHPTSQPITERKFSNDPKINAILNETTPFSNHQRTGMGGAAAAMAERYQSNPHSSPTMEGGFTPSMPSMGELVGNGREVSPEIPMGDMPDGISVMDVKQHTPPAIQRALSRNYSQVMKLIDKKQGRK